MIYLIYFPLVSKLNKIDFKNLVGGVVLGTIAPVTAIDEIMCVLIKICVHYHNAHQKKKFFLRGARPPPPPQFFFLLGSKVN